MSTTNNVVPSKEGAMVMDVGWTHQSRRARIRSERSGKTVLELIADFLKYKKWVVGTQRLTKSIKSLPCGCENPNQNRPGRINVKRDCLTDPWVCVLHGVPINANHPTGNGIGRLVDAPSRPATLDGSEQAVADAAQ